MPDASSRVLALQFQDEDFFYGRISGTVRWEPGVLTVTDYFVIFVAQNAYGKGQLQAWWLAWHGGMHGQVAANVPAEAQEWNINVLGPEISPYGSSAVSNIASETVKRWKRQVLEAFLKRFSCCDG